MKKYALFSFVFILSLCLLGSFGAKSANAWDSGCTAAGPYSTKTGNPCNTTPVTPVACAPGASFSFLTGQPCGTTTTTSTTPVISSLSTTSGPIGTQITITGSGFSSLSGLAAGNLYGVWLSGGNYTSENTGVSGLSSSSIIGPAISNGLLQATNDNSITVAIPSMVCPGAETPSCSSNFQTNILPGNYVIYVKNANGSSNKIPFTVTSGTFPPGCTSTTNYSTTTGNPCFPRVCPAWGCNGPKPITPITTPISQNGTYGFQNSAYGVSFTYPNTWTSATDASAISAMGNYGFSIPSNATSLITLKVPTTAYPGTDFGGGYLNLSVSQQLSASQCLALNPQNSSTPGQGTVNVDGVTFNWTSEGGAAAGTETGNYSYSGYTNGNCYEFNYSDVTYGGSIGTNGVTNVGSAPGNDIKNVITGAMFASTATTTSSPAVISQVPNLQATVLTASPTSVNLS